MLKKLLSLFGLGEKEEEQTEKKSYETRKPVSPKKEDDEEDDEDEEEEDNKKVKKQSPPKQQANNKKRHEDEDDDEDDEEEEEEEDDDDDDDDNDDDNDDDDDDDDDEEPELKDLDFSEEEEERMEEGDGKAGTYDPVTFHSLKYTEKQFLDEVEKRMKEFIKNREVKGKVFTDADKLLLKGDIGRRIFLKWNNGLRYEKFSMAWQEKIYNVTSFESAKHDNNNPLLAPIHGVTLQDYAAMANKLAAGLSLADLLAALGIEKPVWDEAATLWGQRLQEDATSTVANLYMRYMTESDKHPKLSMVQAAPKSGEGKANAERILNDERFYVEVFAARTAAYEHGYDGTQWMLDKYGIDMTDMQKAITKWGVERNKDLNNPRHEEMDKYMIEMEDKYAAEFTKEQGGGIADDIEF